MASQVPPIEIALRRMMKAAMVHAPSVEVSPKDIELILTGWREATEEVRRLKKGKP